MSIDKGIAPQLPPEALARHIAILGKTGSGKTYAAKGLVERLLSGGRRVCIIDPTAAWWGLRTSADGTGPGFPVVVLGGRHGDAELPPLSGHACGELVCGQPLQIVFDVSSMGVAERGRWFTAFAEAVFRKNVGPLHLVIDEAHMFAPQGATPDPQAAQMLHAANTLASGGRSRGVRLMLITQRPAKLHKDTLTQADALIAMKVMAPQDRKAVEDWIKGAGDKDKASEVLDSLAQLRMGEGWVWAPDCGILGRGMFPRIATFDSSATPGDDAAIVVPSGRAQVDLSAITSSLAIAAEEVKASDPRTMKAEIAKLKEELAKERRTPVRIDAGEMGKAQEQIARLQKQVDEANALVAEYAWMCTQIQAVRDTLDGVSRLEGFKGAGSEGERHGRSAGARLRDRVSSLPAGDQRPGEHKAGIREAAGRRAGVDEATRDDAARDTPAVDLQRLPKGGAPADRAGATRRGGTLEKGPGLILDAIAWWRRLGHTRPLRAQVAAVAGYAPTGGSFARYISTLTSEGLVTGGDGQLSITEAGSKLAAWPDAAPTLAKLHERVLGILDGGPRKILEVLIKAGGDAVGRTAVAEDSGYEPTGGSFARYLSTLSSLGLITYPKRTTVAAAQWLFQEWRA